MSGTSLLKQFSLASCCSANNLNNVEATIKADVQKVEAEAQSLLSIGLQAATVLLQAAVTAAQEFNAAIPKLITFLQTVKTLYPNNPQVQTDIDLAIKGLNAIMLTATVAEGLATDALAVQKPSTPQQLVDTITEGQGAVTTFTTYINSLQALGIPTGNAAATLASVNSVMTQADAIANVAKLVAGTPAATPAAVAAPAAPALAGPTA